VFFFRPIHTALTDAQQRRQSPDNTTSLLRHSNSNRQHIQSIGQNHRLWPKPALTESNTLRQGYPTKPVCRCAVNWPFLHN